MKSTQEVSFLVESMSMNTTMTDPLREVVWGREGGKEENTSVCLCEEEKQIML
jgi:hypothetical protein